MSNLIRWWISFVGDSAINVVWALARTLCEKPKSLAESYAVRAEAHATHKHGRS